MLPRWTSLALALLAAGCQNGLAPPGASSESSTTATLPTTATGSTSATLRATSASSTATTTSATAAPTSATTTSAAPSTATTTAAVTSTAASTATSATASASSSGSASGSTVASSSLDAGRATSGSTGASTASHEACYTSAPPEPRDGCGSSATAGAPCDNAGSGAGEPGTCESATYSFDRCDGGGDLVTYLGCAASAASSSTGGSTFLGFPDASGGDGGEYFACGPQMCDRFTSFCLSQYDTSAGPWCLPLPPECVSNVSCACIESFHTDAGEPYAGNGCSDTDGQVSVFTS